jgi:hypothetical protein
MLGQWDGGLVELDARERAARLGEAQRGGARKQIQPQTQWGATGEEIS